MPDFAKATLAYTLPWDADWVTAVAFVGPTRRLVAGNNRGELLAWDLPEKPGPTPPVLRLEGHTNVISRLIATSDGKQLLSSSYDRTIRVWDLTAKPDGKATVVLNERAREEASRRRGSPKPPAPVEAAVATTKASVALEGHRDWVTAMALSKDEKTLVSGDDASAVIVRDMATKKETRRWPLKGWAYAIALSPDAKRALVSERIPLVFDSARRDGVAIRDMAGKVERDLSAEFKGQYLSAAVWHPDGKTVFVGRGGEASGMLGVHTVDATTGKKTRSFPGGHQEGVTDLALHPDGKHLASCGRDTTVKIWEVATGKLVATLGKGRGGQFKDWYHALSFSADGKLLAAGDMAGAVHVWTIPA